jgi:TonB-dependent SusC/RagA subfamily outer membrane receptor
MSKYLLHINEPCSQNWDEMTATEKGRFCSNCKKTVFDFTSATDNEIVNHIKAMKDEIFCGRFEEQQLDRWIITNSLETSNKKLYQLLLSFILLTGGQNLYAQDVVKKETILLQKKIDSLSSLSALKSEMPDVSCDSVKSGIVSNTRIRMGGVRSLNGDLKPLLILNGKNVLLSVLSTLNPNEIKSVEILKSAVSTAIYGPDGVNGAILIVTKEVKKVKTKPKTLLNPNS